MKRKSENINGEQGLSFIRACEFAWVFKTLRSRVEKVCDAVSAFLPSSGKYSCFVWIYWLQKLLLLRARSLKKWLQVNEKTIHCYDRQMNSIWKSRSNRILYCCSCDDKRLKKKGFFCCCCLLVCFLMRILLCFEGLLRSCVRGHQGEQK